MVDSSLARETLSINETWRETCERAARAGGRALVEWRGRFSTREKAPSDLVTDADLASQEAVRREIAAQFPRHAFLGEESAQSCQHGADEMTWIVDPLDGTTNYVHDYSQYAVSVALARGNELLVGVVYDPIADECFSAAKGQGAHCNGEPIAVSGVAQISGALAAVSLPARVTCDSPDLQNFVKASQVCQALRRTGSAALNLANVARGSFDAFWASHIRSWDVAAGILLVREAGGVVTGLDGREFDLWRPHFIACATPPLHASLRAILSASD